MGRSEETWYPPRPIIKKDEEAVKKLYGEDKPPAPSNPVIRGRFKLLMAIDSAAFEDDAGTE
jgi:hypothetical protein